MLRKQFEVHQVSIGGTTIAGLWRQVEYHLPFKPTIVILQCGIVDCAPRALTQFELDLLKRIWGVRNVVLPWIKKNASMLRGRRNKTYVKPQDFKKYLKRIKEAFPEARVYAIGIVPPNDEYEAKIRGIKERVVQFDKFLADEFKEHYISLNDLPRNGVMSDFIHLTEEGHKMVFQKVTMKISR
jgi:hypothetical protein